MSDQSGNAADPTRRAVLAAGSTLGLGLLAGCAPAGGAAPSSAANSDSPSNGPTGSAGPAPAPSTPPGTSGAPYPTLAVPPNGADVTTGPATRPHIALTFHGQGDPSIARAVLAACAAAEARVTVFAVGQWVSANPTLIREIAAQGHDVGNHTWSHQEMPTLGAAAANAEVAKAADALMRATGSSGAWFRPSGTRFSTPTIRAAAAASGYARCISYDVDPEDYTDPGTAAVRSRVAAQLHPGAIVSLHLGHDGTVAALPGILADARAAGFTAVTMTQLLGGS